MRLITSIAPTRIERQQYCISTWLKHTTDIVSINTKNEIETLQPYFPNLSFRIGDTSTSFSKSTPKLTELIKIADEPSLLINSDISIEDNNLDQWTWDLFTLKIGIRYDYYSHNPLRRYYQKWGIDAFLILPEMISILPDLDFCVGCPGWDFWLPYHLWSRYNYKIQVVPGSLLHEFHKVGWSESDQVVYRSKMVEHYKVTPTMIPYFILDITDRHRVPHVQARA